MFEATQLTRAWLTIRIILEREKGKSSAQLVIQIKTNHTEPIEFADKLFSGEDESFLIVNILSKFNDSTPFMHLIFCVQLYTSNSCIGAIHCIPMQ